MSSFHIINFGCRATQADGGEIEREMVARNFAKAESVTQASVVVLNTCTVTAAADRDARQTIRRVQRENPNAKIVVTGCYAQRAPEEISRIHGVHVVVGNSHKHELVQIVDARLEHGSNAHISGARGENGEVSRALSSTAEVYMDQYSRLERGSFSGHAYFGATERTRPSLKIQDGCDANCSFCIIPAVRGRSRSLNPAEVRKQVETLVAEGYQEIVLSGIHLGSYGRDLAERTSFYELLQTLELLPGLCRLRLSSIEPMEVTDDIIAHVAASRKFAGHFHVPLQSGSDRLLHLMRRPYTSGQYMKVVEAVRGRIPEAAIGADVIAGFPGETEEEHRATLQFIEQSPLTYLHVFSFSSRPGTTAAAMRGHLSPQIIKRRSAELRDLGKRKKFKFQQTMRGRALSVITLDRRGDGGTEAMSGNFLEVIVRGTPLGPNQMVQVKIDGMEQGVLVGRLAEESFSLPLDDLSQCRS